MLKLTRLEENPNIDEELWIIEHEVYFSRKMKLTEEREHWTMVKKWIIHCLIKIENAHFLDNFKHVRLQFFRPICPNSKVELLFIRVCFKGFRNPKNRVGRGHCYALESRNINSNGHRYPTKMLHTRNDPNSEIKITRYDYMRFNNHPDVTPHVYTHNQSPKAGLLSKPEIRMNRISPSSNIQKTRKRNKDKNETWINTIIPLIQPNKACWRHIIHSQRIARSLEQHQERELWN